MRLDKTYQLGYEESEHSAFSSEKSLMFLVLVITSRENRSTQYYKIINDVVEIV
jgi:hypothetical protein